MTLARSLVIPALLAAAVAALLLRIVSIAEPLGIDQSLWASAVRAMARGQLLYRDVWEQRPPGIYWIYLAGFQLLGWKTSTVAWLDVIASSVTALLIFVSVRQLTTTVTAALATALYAALTMPAWLYGYGGFLERSVSETFIVLCVCAMACAAAAMRATRSPVAALAMGFFAGGLVILKPNAVLYFPALLLWLALYGGGWREVRGTAALAIAASAIVPGLALLWLWKLGLLAEARIAVIDFNRYYVGEGFALGTYALEFSKAVWLRIKTDPLWLAGTAGALAAIVELSRTRRLPPVAGLALIWGAAAVVVIVVNGARLFNSYFINGFVPLAIMAAWFLSDAARQRRAFKALAIATCVAMAFLLVQRGYAARVGGWASIDASALRGREDAQNYLERFGGYNNRRGYSARANAELASYVQARTTPDERVFLFGINGAGLYFLADRLPGHRFLRVNFYVETDFPDPRFRLESVLADLAADPPRYVIFERLHASRAADMRAAVDSLPQHPAVVRFLEAYALETTIEDFTVYRRIT